MGNALPMNSVMLSAAFAGDMDDAALVFHENRGTIPTEQREWDPVQIVRGQRTAFQRQLPDSRELLAQLPCPESTGFQGTTAAPHRVCLHLRAEFTEIRLSRGEFRHLSKRIFVAPRVSRAL